MKSFRRVRSRDSADSKAPEQADDRESQEEHARIDFSAVKRFCEKRTAHAAENNRQKRPKFENAVAPRELFRGEEFRQQPIFRRPKQRPLGANKEYRRERQGQMWGHQSCGGDQHHPHLKDFCPDRDGAFAESIREEPAHERKQDEGSREQHADQQFHLVALRFVLLDGKNEINDQELEAIFIERALELRDDQAPKAQPPILCRLMQRGVLGIRYPRAPILWIESQRDRTILPAVLADRIARCEFCADKGRCQGARARGSKFGRTSCFLAFPARIWTRLRGPGFQRNRRRLPRSQTRWRKRR